MLPYPAGNRLWWIFASLIIDAVLLSILPFLTPVARGFHGNFKHGQRAISLFDFNFTSMRIAFAGFFFPSALIPKLQLSVLFQKTFSFLISSELLRSFFFFFSRRSLSADFSLLSQLNFLFFLGSIDKYLIFLFIFLFVYSSNPRNSTASEFQAHPKPTNDRKWLKKLSNEQQREARERRRKIEWNELGGATD